MEAALDECRAKLGELVYENVLLRAQVKELEAAAQQAAEAPARAPVTLGGGSAGE